jgi:hypothetical protein
MHQQTQPEAPSPLFRIESIQLSTLENSQFVSTLSLLAIPSRIRGTQALHTNSNPRAIYPHSPPTNIQVQVHILYSIDSVQPPIRGEALCHFNTRKIKGSYTGRAVVTNLETLQTETRKRKRRRRRGEKTLHESRYDRSIYANVSHPRYPDHR